MPLPGFRKLVSSDNIVSRLQDTIYTIFAWINRREILDGLLIKDVNILAAPTAVDHGLGRAALGYIVVRTTFSGNPVYQVSATVTTLTLQSTDPVIVDLWVF